MKLTRKLPTKEGYYINSKEQKPSLFTTHITRVKRLKKKLVGTNLHFVDSCIPIKEMYPWWSDRTIQEPEETK